jgi:hypothetical protein
MLTSGRLGSITGVKGLVQVGCGSGGTAASAGTSAALQNGGGGNSSSNLMTDELTLKPVLPS